MTQPALRSAAPAHRAIWWLTALAWSSSLAGAQTTQDTLLTERCGDAVLFSAWFHEVLDADFERAQETYMQVAEAKLLPQEQRAFASMRWLDLARLSGDLAAIERAMQVRGARRVAIEQRIRESVPPTAIELRLAVKQGDQPRIRELRQRYIDLATQDQGLLARQNTMPVDGRWEPREQGSMPAASEPRGRFLVPLGVSLHTELGTRAAQIVLLRLAGQDRQAEALEADSLDRLQPASDPPTPEPDPVTPGSESQEVQQARIRQAIDQADRAVGTGLLTTLEDRALNALLQRLRDLQSEGNLERANTLVRLLPWTDCNPGVPEGTSAK